MDEIQPSNIVNDALHVRHATIMRKEVDCDSDESERSLLPMERQINNAPKIKVDSRAIVVK